jgi:nanoRNase/pAp phosphatase (c-di-AMP/oligoRNAs hydrolase)
MFCILNRTYPFALSTEKTKNSLRSKSVGHSIINRTSDVDVGHLTLRYGGGGHKRAGACQVSYEDADKIIQEMLEVINKGKGQSKSLSLR